MKRLAFLSTAVLLFVGGAITSAASATAGPATGRRTGGVPAGLEQIVFIDSAVGAAVGAPTADASATDFRFLRGRPSWSTPTTVNYRVSATGCGSDCVNAVADVDNAFNSWEFSGVTYTNNGTGNPNPCTPGFNNAVSWGLIDGAGGTLGITSVCSNRLTHEILGFSTVFDSQDPWSDSGDANSFDIQAAATHEEGHTTGLDHVHAPRDARLTMYPALSLDDQGFATLGCGDILGIDALYGETMDCSAVPLD